MPSNFPLPTTHQRDARDEREPATAHSCRPTPPRHRSLDSPHSPPYRNEVNQKPLARRHSREIMAFKPNLFVLHLCHNPYLSGRLATCWVTRVRPEWSLIAEFRLPPIFRPRTFSKSRLKD